ncbi:MAG: amidohydrolase, partial [Chloroflexota bacterium]
MESIAEMKERVCSAIDDSAGKLINIGEDILRHPELGFKERRTAGIVSSFLSELGIPHQHGLAVTGVKAVLDSGRSGPTVGVFGELDSLLVRDHPLADPVTGAAHACGHNAQVVALLALAAAFTNTDVMASLQGRIALLAVPAEEYVELEYRLGLKEEGVIEFLGGKPEFVRLGLLDDVDMAMMVHLSSRPEEGKAGLAASNNGCFAKVVEFRGRAAHAGGAPEKGVNALSAATIALAAINAQRETFRDQDTVRVHPIITKGGELVNVIPADVRLETFVRGRTLEAIRDANRKVDRCLRAGALAMGAKVRIKTLPGYMPCHCDPHLGSLFKQNAVQVVGPDNWQDIGHRTGSTDMGDISQIMPAIHPQVGGATGISHG